MPLPSPDSMEFEVLKLLSNPPLACDPRNRTVPNKDVLQFHPDFATIGSGREESDARLFLITDEYEPVRDMTDDIGDDDELKPYLRSPRAILSFVKQLADVSFSTCDTPVKSSLTVCIGCVLHARISSQPPCMSCQSISSRVEFSNKASDITGSRS